ncbi:MULTISPECIES: hypothetical protein [unclassified Streptomyces]|uniref:hypothetical protein n=1 Tax=unclassified Streptomyces TaxID=2593676 RepID=UPI001BEA219C|nr:MULTISPECIES: hypothetical protein [unclassified Streptomyces]MBT2404283.1 hypothetical protein [Streptomyces sp. ISL-21]MBT2611988.1 hypothetical protein [Streptomyces sp. ISL-87]
MKKMFVTLLAATAMAGLGLQGTATAAPTGWPEGCKSWKVPESNGIAAACSDGNGGRWKASAKCAPWNGDPVIQHDAVAWSSSNTSFAFCPPFTSVVSGSFWTRSY